MRFVIVTIGSQGDVRPYIALGRELKQHNHDVAIATLKNYSAMINDFGIEFILIEDLPPGPVPLLAYVNHRMISSILSARMTDEAFLMQMWKVCQKADVLIYNPITYPCFYVAEKLGIPSFAAFVQPHHSTKAFPHPYLTYGKPLGGFFNKAGFITYSMLHWLFVRKSINKWRKEILGLPPLALWNTLLKQMRQNGSGFLYAYSPSFVPVPPDWRNNQAVVTGYWHIDTSVNYNPPVELDHFLNSGPPIVFISITWNREKFSKNVLLEICDLLGCRLFVHDLYGELNEVTSTETLFYYKGAIPHEWIFKKVSIAVHHGGLGITMNCIREELPMIAIPAFGYNDHRFWAYHIGRSGVGIHLNDSGKSRKFPRRLAQAIRTAMNSEKMKLQITAMSRQVKAENGLQNAVRIIIDRVNASIVKISSIVLINYHFIKFNICDL